MSSMALFIVAPTMPNAATSATPKVRANAVVAVRRGFLREFVDANFPTAPNGAPKARPSAGTIGMDSAGEARKVPTITNKAPAPRMPARTPVSASLRTRATTAATTPSRTTIPPAMVRSFNGDELETSPERIASTGCTRPARRAGDHAETTVMSTPITRGRITACGVRLSSVLGRPNPAISMIAKMPLASPMPATMPNAEPTRPTRTASKTTEVVSWLREAPRERSRANSRMRWATTMEKVLAMMNAPTSRLTRAKASRK